MGNAQTKSTELSDNEMSQILNLLGEEEKYVQTITGLISFGVFKFIVIPLLQEVNDKRKEYIKKKLLLLLRLHHLLNHHHQLIRLVLQSLLLMLQSLLLILHSLLPSLGKRKFF
jgi:hypothetical protein